MSYFRCRFVYKSANLQPAIQSFVQTRVSPPGGKGKRCLEQRAAGVIPPSNATLTVKKIEERLVVESFNPQQKSVLATSLAPLMHVGKYISL